MFGFIIIRFKKQILYIYLSLFFQLNMFLYVFKDKTQKSNLLFKPRVLAK
jgi:hypothetical protein